MTSTPLTNKALTALLGGTGTPCVSFFQPTHRLHPDNQQDPIRFRNLLKDIQLNLQERFPAEVVSPLMEDFNELGADASFWNHTQDGLAVFATPGQFTAFVLPRRVVEHTVVADSFHTKPLRRFLQTIDRFQVLGISQHGIKLFEGNRDGLHAVELADEVPATIEEALGDQLTEPHLTVASYGGVGGDSSSMHHGHSGKQDEVENDTNRFFRSIDRTILEHHSRPSGLPLILAALPEHHNLFQKISHNPLLVAEGIKGNPDALSNDELCTRAWEVFEPQYRSRLQSWADDFAVASSQGLGLDDLSLIGEAATAGRIATLLIEADREIVGRIHQGSGNVHIGADDTELADDLLDDLGEAVLKMGGDVFVIPANQMPTTTGAAATCRY